MEQGWQRQTKYQFHMKQSSLFSLAGIYEDFQNEDGLSYNAFSILTINPNPLVSLVHDRMPVILSRQQEEIWLDNTVQNIPLLKSIIRPYDEAEWKWKRCDARHYGKGLLKRFPVQRQMHRKCHIIS